MPVLDYSAGIAQPKARRRDNEEGCEKEKEGVALVLWRRGEKEEEEYNSKTRISEMPTRIVVSTSPYATEGGWEKEVT